MLLLLLLVVALALVAVPRALDVRPTSRREWVGGVRVAVKEGVQIDGTRPEMAQAIRAARQAGLSPVVTSAVRPGDADSFHRTGRALDFRSRHLEPRKRKAVADHIRSILPNRFSVINEQRPAHIHVALR